MSNSKTYKLQIASDVETCTLQLQKYSQAKLKQNDKEVSKISGIGGDTISFTISDGSYVDAIVNCTYAHNKINNIKSQCNVCFILVGSSSFIWQVTGTITQGDNPSMFVPSTMSNKTEYDTNLLQVIVPTVKNNPNIKPNDAQTLRPSQLLIVDYDAKNKNLLVRGNSPLGEENKRGQLINFLNLENAIKQACKAASIDPVFDKYVLHDISLLSKAEEYIWANEYFSFGNTESPSTDTETWFPPTAAKIPGFNHDNKKGQWCRWDVQPDLIGQTLADLVTKLKTYMTAGSKDKDTLDIYYIHCASGHDRTGMVSATYIADKFFNSSNLDVPYVMGTTLQKQASATASGYIFPDCDDWRSGQPSTTRSRCFMAGATYKETFIKAMEILQPSLKPFSLSEKSSKTPPNNSLPYVFDAYPFPVLG